MRGGRRVEQPAVAQRDAEPEPCRRRHRHRGDEGGDQIQPGGQGLAGQLARAKDAYLKSKNIGITTTRLDRLKLSEVEDAMKNGCDVELSVLRRVDGKLIGHVVAITSIQKVDGGYALVMTHDTDQGAKGGTANEAVTYDNATGRFTGPTWITNKVPDSFIAECAKGGT